MGDDKNPFEGNGAPEMVATVQKSKQDLLLEEAERKSAEDLKNRKEGRVSKSSESKKSSKPKTPKTPKPKAEKKPKVAKAPKAPKAKKVAKPRKASTSNRAPRVVLTEKQLGEARETIRIRPAIIAMVDKFAKLWKMETNEAAEKMLTTAVGRLNALSRYNEG